MAANIQVNELLKEAYQRRYSPVNRESLDVRGNGGALVGLLIGILGVLLLAFALHSQRGNAAAGIVDILFHPLFLIASIPLVLLPTGLLGGVGAGVARVLLEKNEKLQELVNSAESDPLSGLANRRSFIRALEKELQRVRRASKEAGTLGLVFIDIDHFKKINDTYGHAAGDEVICQLSRFLEQSCRPYDTVARWGGEEFVLLTPQTTADQAQRFGDRIRKGVEELKLRYDYQFIHYTISLGIATYESNEESLDEFLQRADEMLYRSKESGRNRVSFSAGPAAVTG